MSTTAGDQAGVLQSRIDAAHAAGGGCIFLEPGVYPISRGLKLRGNIAIIGAGATATRLVPVDPIGFNEHFFSMAKGSSSTVENITIRGIAIDGGLTVERQHYPEPICHDLPELARLGATPDRMGVYLCDRDAKATLKNLFFSDLMIRNCANGIHLLGAENVVIEGCFLEGNGCVEEHYHNLYIRRSSGVRVRNCSMVGSPGGVGFNLGVSSRDIHVESCLFAGNGFRGARFDGAEGGLANLTIENCLFLDNAQNAAQPALKIHSVMDWSIKNCVFRGNRHSEMVVTLSRRGFLGGNVFLDDRAPRLDFSKSTYREYETSSNALFPLREPMGQEPPSLRTTMRRIMRRIMRKLRAR